METAQRLVVKTGDDEEDGVGAVLDRLGQLPLIDHKILTKERQRDGLADGTEVVE